MSATPSRRHPVSSQSHRSQSRRPSTASSAGPELAPLPAYQTPEAPLTIPNQRQIATLLSSTHFRTLRTHLQHAAEKLTHSGGEVNERLCDARIRYQKSKESRQRKGEEDIDEEGDEEYQRLADVETRVQAITARMEEKTRLIVDSEVKLEGLTEAMTHIEREEGEAVSAAQGARQTRQQRARQRAEAEDDADEEDPQDGDYEDPAEREARERNAQNPPSRKLDDKLMEGVQKWDGLSLTEKYANNNSYIGFYRMVHDSKFPGDDVPPLPHSSTWFSHMEETSAPSGGSPRTRQQNRAPSPADSDDIAIERERVSLKCPLTLTPYVDPVTSTKCPHSFEREAIMDMLRRSKTTIAPPASRRGQRRIQMVKCPVCSSPLTADDLRPDPVLQRRVRRAQELQEREEEDDHLEGEGRKQKDRGTNITLASDGESDDDAMDVDAPPTQPIKPEPLSQPAEADQPDSDAESEDTGSTRNEEDEDDGEYQEEGNGENNEGEENDNWQNEQEIDEPHSTKEQPDEGLEEEQGEQEDVELEAMENEEEQNNDIEHGNIPEDVSESVDTQSQDKQNDVEQDGPEAVTSPSHEGQDVEQDEPEAVTRSHQGQDEEDGSTELDSQTSEGQNVENEQDAPSPAAPNDAGHVNVQSEGNTHQNESEASSDYDSDGDTSAKIKTESEGEQGEDQNHSEDSGVESDVHTDPNVLD